MFDWLFHAPRRAFEAWVRLGSDGFQASRSHPAGGKCHGCGIKTNPDERMCEDCYDSHQI
jgi:uncharacterized OB-fold protein